MTRRGPRARAPSPFWHFARVLEKPRLRRPQDGARAAEAGVERGESRHRLVRLCPVGNQAILAIAAHVAARDRLHADPVAARDDVHAVVGEAVVEIRLRDEPGDLAAHRHHALVSEQGPCAVAGAVDHDLLGQLGELAGGRIERREFHSPGELAELPEKVVINCTGYGARALLGDESVVPAVTATTSP